MIRDGKFYLSEVTISKIVLLCKENPEKCYEFLACLSNQLTNYEQNPKSLEDFHKGVEVVAESVLGIKEGTEKHQEVKELIHTMMF